ncbi:MAG: F0F1 ATP synthase subunit gamma [Candidatus Omnitrophica bacterium]|nr:F0F1 ATP synthase subunit gamma [Candidatus Omnitrophota bacterium]
MIPIAQLKGDMEFYKSLGSLIEVLKLVAAAQYQTLEKKIKTYGLYLDALSNVFSWLDMQQVRHPFVTSSDKPGAIVAITTDAGFLGGLNSLVMNKALEEAKISDSRMVIVGKRGQLYVEKREMVYANFPGVDDLNRLQQALKLRDYLIENVLKGKFGKVAIVFPRALSFTSQRIEVLQVFPFVCETSQKMNNLQISDVILESKFGDIVEYMIYLWLGQKIFEIFGMARLSEQAARFMHLEKCTDRIQDLDKKLRFQYFRAKHEIIDQNMRELFAARLLNG